MIDHLSRSQPVLSGQWLAGPHTTSQEPRRTTIAGCCRRASSCKSSNAVPSRRPYCMMPCPCLYCRIRRSAGSSRPHHAGRGRCHHLVLHVSMHGPATPRCSLRHRAYLVKEEKCLQRQTLLSRLLPRTSASGAELVNSSRTRQLFASLYRRRETYEVKVSLSLVLAHTLFLDMSFDLSVWDRQARSDIDVTALDLTLGLHESISHLVGLNRAWARMLQIWLWTPSQGGRVSDIICRGR
ncbi:hypothetical protein OH76DRAFT_1022160 [Lentinus brumalis]|uniref:Uncharacterized protein n=1 Tax=Lentinus brumalis TaxID=2498619 RepID=A0A371CXY4_9APHY|nr:hypothetical protein OH76DRAFT_1022160 [Polyporus brumalis]